MESALCGIFTLVGEVSEISLVRCAHSFDFRYFPNSCENPVRARFPWSNLYFLIEFLSNVFPVITSRRSFYVCLIEGLPQGFAGFSNYPWNSCFSKSKTECLCLLCFPSGKVPQSNHQPLSFREGISWAAWFLGYDGTNKYKQVIEPLWGHSGESTIN